jgi:hypothetical protein
VGTVFQIGVTIATPWLAYFGVVFIIDRIDNLEVPTQSPVSAPRSVAETLNPTIAPTEADTELALGVKTAFIFGGVFAFITAAFMTAVFIPTMVSTTLKFRRGVIPSLRSEAFLRYRRALDEVANLFGGMLWGVLISSVMIAAIVGGFVYLLLWPTTSRVMFSFIGNYLGLLIVIITRLIAVKCLRSAYFAAFYRKKPFSGNIMTIIMECYSVAISVWFMVVRGIKILNCKTCPSQSHKKTSLWSTGPAFCHHTTGSRRYEPNHNHAASRHGSANQSKPGKPKWR